ncbi:MAG: hypothetical protein ACC653_08050 [Gammaproteobacteria bacterium]
MLTTVTLLACESSFKRIDENKGDIYHWPKKYQNSDNVNLTIYQPQIIKWVDYKYLRSRVVITYQATPETSPVYGSVILTANTNVDLPTKNIKLVNLKVTTLKVPNLNSESKNKLLDDIQNMLPEDGIIMSLNRITANYSRHAKSRTTSKIKANPPVIFISNTPALLVIFNGKPLWSPIKDNKLKFAVNTNWDIFQDKASKNYYLLNEKDWYTTTDLQKSWSPSLKLPDAFYNLPDTDNWKDVKANLPTKTLTPTTDPNFFVSTKPAELILINGKPELKPVANTSLAWVSNTNSDLFFSSKDSYYYYLVSGRWFRTKQLTNNSKWEFISENLPEDFKNIPTNNPRASVRASVPGTIEAETAIIMAQIPYKVEVDKSITKPKVVYAGDPDFKPITDTKLTYAVNTSSDVIYFEKKYYLCQDGIWFFSIDAKGPWKVATQIPKEIYQIPPSSPLYHTTFVHIYSSSPNTVTVGYTSGYSNVYVSYGVVVYGSGWYYPPYWYYGSYYRYPIYYPYPHTFGARTYYNPTTGTYGRAGWAYGPYGGIGYGSAYNPDTGKYARGSAAYGPSGANLWISATNPRTNTQFATRQGTDYYSSWGATAIKRDDKWAATARYTNDQGTARGFKTSEGDRGFIARDENNLYAGKNGEVYRRTEDGWQKRQDGSWNDISPPTTQPVKSKAGDLKQKYPAAGNKAKDYKKNSTRPTTQQRNYDQLNRDYKQRQYGQEQINRQRTQPTGGYNRGQFRGGGGIGGRRR